MNDLGGIDPYWPSAEAKWTVEFRARIISTDPANNEAVGIDFRNAAVSMGVRISTNAVLLASGGDSSASYAVGTDWNVFRLTMENNVGKLYANFNHIPILTKTGSGSGSFLEFGDFGPMAGSAEYDYIRWTFNEATGFAIPEPGISLLMATGLVVVRLGYARGKARARAAGR